MMVHAFNFSIWEAEAGDFWAGGQTGLQSEFQDSEGYTEKPCLEKRKKKKKEKKEFKTRAFGGQYLYSIIIFSPMPNA